MLKINKSGVRSVISWFYSAWSASLTVMVGFILVLFVASVVLVKTRTGPDNQLIDRSPLGSGVATSEVQIASEQDSAMTVVYQVAKGDSLWKLADTFLKDARQYPVIAKLNNLPVDARLEVGQEILVPLDHTLVDLPEQNLESSQSLIAKTSQADYVVQAGDCLWQIAQQELGDPYLWPVIYQLNQDLVGNDANLILPGQKLSLPLVQ